MAFSFGNLIKPESPQNNVVNPITLEELAKTAPPTSVKVNPTVEEIMRKAQEALNKPASLSEAVKNVKKETTTPMPPLDIPEGVAPISPVSIEIPSITMPEKVETKVEMPKVEVNSELKHIHEDFEKPERVFVESFLKVFNDVVEMGKKLETINQDKSTSAKAYEEKNKENEILKSDALKIEESIKALQEVNDDEKGGEELNNILTSFQGYLNLVEEKLALDARNERTASNKFGLEIGKIKTEINKLIGEIGGQVYFDRIKSYIRKAEMIRKNGEDKVGNAEISIETMRMISEQSVALVSSSDMHVAQEAFSNGDMMSILQIMFAQK